MKGRIKGKITGIMVQGTYFACELDSELIVEKEMIAATPTIDGRWNEYLAGRRDWQVVVNSSILMEGLPADFKSMFTAFDNDLELEIQFGVSISETEYLFYEGSGQVRSLAASAPISGFATGVTTIQGIGPLIMDYQNLTP